MLEGLLLMLIAIVIAALFERIATLNRERDDLLINQRRNRR